MVISPVTIGLASAPATSADGCGCGGCGCGAGESAGATTSTPRASDELAATARSTTAPAVDGQV